MNEFEVELKARSFVMQSGIDSAPVDLSVYLKKFAAKVITEELDPEEAGYTVTTPKGSVVAVNQSDRETRQRFTICHEIAHLELGIESDHDYGPKWTFNKRPLGEILCDVFAAELLLPYRIFMKSAGSRPIDFSTVESLSKDFGASREATASRLAATSKFPCAYILSEGGTVHHVVRSRSLRDAGIWISRDAAVSPRTIAGRLREQGGSADTEEIDADSWFSGLSGVSVTESSIYIPRFDQTLTLLTVEQDEVDDLIQQKTVYQAGLADRDDDALLKPLDGQLRWPSKR